MSSRSRRHHGIGLELHAQHHLERRAIGGAGRRVPAFAEALAQRVDLALRQLRGLAVGLAQRWRSGQLLSGRGLAQRLALVEQRRDLVRIERWLRLRLLLAAFLALALSSAFFFASSFFKVMAIGSMVGCSFFSGLASAFCGSGGAGGSFFSGLVSAFAGSGGGGGASALAASRTFLSVTLALESSTGLARRSSRPAASAACPWTRS